VIVIAIYILAGFFLIPYLGKYYANRYVEDELERRLALQELRFNPFTLKAEAHNLRLMEDNGSLIMGFAFFSADFDLLSSIANRAWTFSKIGLIDPEVHVIAEDGGTNLSRMMEKTGSNGQRKPAEAEGGIPEIIIEEASLRGGAVDFIDRRQTPPADIHIRSLSLELEEVATIPDRRGGYRVSGRTGAKERFHWRGTLSLNPLQSEGAFSLEKVKAATVWEFLKDAVQIEEPPGYATLSGEYLFDLGEKEPLFRISALEFNLFDFALTPKGAQSPLLSIKRAGGIGGRFNSQEESFSLDRVSIEGGRVGIAIDESGVADWSGIIGISNERENDLSEENGEDGESPMGSWKAAVNAFILKDFQVRFTDRTASPSVDITIDPFEFALTGFSTSPDAAVEYGLRAILKEGGEITAKGQLWPWHSQIKGNLQIDEFSLLILQPYLAHAARLTLESGTADLSGDLTFDGSGETIAIAYQGKGGIQNVTARTEDADEPYWRLDSMSLPAIDFSFPPAALEIEEARIAGPAGRLVIYPDRTVNISQLTIDKDEKEPGKEPSEPLKLTVERIYVDEGRLAFSDLSLRPQFSTRIHELKGTVTGISSVPETVAAVELDGRADEHGSVKIRGESDLFNPTDTTDLNMVFRNIEMTSLTPYAIRFAGYRIASGTLYLDLLYNIEQGKLVGENQIIAEQLKLGEPVKSPTALDLPFKLAISLLKNSEGVIDIGLPVSGDLNNPQFDFGDVIGKAVSTLVTNIVSAPFSWLASLIGSEKEDLDRVFFDPGSTGLLPPARENLIDIAKALAQRPELQLEITGGYDQEADVPALKSLLMRNRLEAQLQRPEDFERAPGPPVFHAGETQKAIEELFVEYGSPSVLAALRSEYLNKLETAEGKYDLSAWVDFYKNLYTRMEAQIEISEARLEELARTRAQAIRDFLADEQNVPSGRIEILPPAQTEKGKEKEVASTLTLNTKG